MIKIPETSQRAVDVLFRYNEVDLQRKRSNPMYVGNLFLTGICICVLFVLMGWLFLPNALRPIKIYCVPPNFYVLGREYAD